MAEKYVRTGKAPSEALVLSGDEEGEIVLLPASLEDSRWYDPDDDLRKRRKKNRWDVKEVPKDDPK